MNPLRDLAGRRGPKWVERLEQNDPPDDLFSETREFWNETSGLLLLLAAERLGDTTAIPEFLGTLIEKPDGARLRLHVFVMNGVEMPGRAYATL